MKEGSKQTRSFDQVLEVALTRRSVIKWGGALGATAFLGGCAPSASSEAATTPLFSFEGIAANTADTVTLPPGYDYQVLVSWGDPILKGAPAFSLDATAADQAGQFGDNTDGMSFFPLPDDGGPARGVMAVNSEYINRKFLHRHKGVAMTDDDLYKEILAHGVTLFEVVQQQDGQWQVMQGSPYNRRLHGDAAEFELVGPVAGHALVQTGLDPAGKRVRGTLNNCGNGQTPWGTYLTCEENFDSYFGGPSGTELSKEQLAYDLELDEYPEPWWSKFERFDLSKHPNEANRFGWVVEIDPMAPEAPARKLTGLGRFKHENAALALTDDGRAVAYMGDDERGQHIYKFVSDRQYIEGDKAHNLTLLESGTLYVARFNDDGSGDWLPLVHGHGGLTPENGFADQAEVLVYARLAAKQLGATTMDRPEWLACHPEQPMVFCTLTNNKHRGVKPEHPLNAANPRINNRFGQIIRWRPDKGDHSSDRFDWDFYAIAGNPTQFDDEYAGSDNITADNMFNSPDGLNCDALGRLWIQTDGNSSNEGQFTGQGHNQMLCGDPVSGEIRRFLVGPKGCEVTGSAFDAEMRTLFVGIQHPKGRWPNADKDEVPRSSVIAIRRNDGGIIGS